MAFSDEEIERRRRITRSAVGSLAIEGMVLDEAMLEDLDRVSRGETTTEELIETLKAEHAPRSS